jgi:hypothetical protein
VAHADLKPRTVGEILDGAFNVYRAQFARLALVGILVSVPAVVVAAIFADDAAAAMRAYTSIVEDSAARPSSDPMAPMRMMLGAMEKIIPLSVLAFALQALSRAAAAVAMALVADAAIRRERSAPATSLLRASLPFLVPALVIEVVFDMSVSQLSCCCPPIGLWFAAVLAPAQAILVLERGHVAERLAASAPAFVRVALWPFAACADALARAAVLSWHAATLGRAIAFLTFLLSFVVIFESAATVPFSLHAAESGEWYWVQHCAEALLLPLMGLARALWYFELRARREGADLAVSA